MEKGLLDAYEWYQTIQWEEEMGIDMTKYTKCDTCSCIKMVNILVGDIEDATPCGAMGCKGTHIEISEEEFLALGKEMENKIERLYGNDPLI